MAAVLPHVLPTPAEPRKGNTGARGIEGRIAELIRRGGKTAEGREMVRGAAWKIAAACAGLLPEGKLNWSKHVEPVLTQGEALASQGHCDNAAVWCYVVATMRDKVFPQNGLRWQRGPKPR